MNVSEVFGHDVSNHSANAWADRDAKVCPFKKGPCNKASKVDPIGICSISDGFEAASLCPNRFLQDNVVFRDAARLAFGSGCRVAVFPELRILQIPDPKRDGVFKKIGKVDFVLGNIRAGQVVDFCAVEIQAAYFSGTEIRSALQHFLKNHNFGTFDIDRRPDFRSSAQKRLVPQLQLKVPVFRRWGKKFFVVVDSHFFRALPDFRATSAANSEVTWMVYTLAHQGARYQFEDVRPYFTQWDDVEAALRHARAPDPNDLVVEMQKKLEKTQVPVFDIS